MRRSWSLGRMFGNFGSKSTNKNRKGLATPSRRKLGYEPLEERTLLSVCTWSGAVDNNWATPGNWDVAPELLGTDVLQFDTSPRTITNNDFPAGTPFASIEFKANGFSLTGNDLTLTTGITVDSGVTGSNISLDIAMSGPLNVNVAADVDSNPALTISGVLSGNNYLKKTGPGTLTLGDANTVNTYTGGTTIDAGTLQVGNPAALVQCNNGLLINGGTLDLYGNSPTVGSVSLIQGSIIDSTATSTTSATLTGSMYVVLGGEIDVPLGNGDAHLIKGTSRSVTLKQNVWEPILESTAGFMDIQNGSIVLDYSDDPENFDLTTIKADLSYSYDLTNSTHWDIGHFRNSVASAAGLSLGWSDNTTDNKITVMAALLADANLDGYLDGLDLNVWRANIGLANATWSQANFNYDSDVDGVDYFLWRNHIGESMDGAPPSVMMLFPMGTDSTNANSVQYVVVFSKEVSHVDANDFALIYDGTSGTIASVDPWTPSAQSDSIYLVTIDDVYGNGTLQLNLIYQENNPIIDANETLLTCYGTGNGSFPGDVYTINTGPAVPTDLTATAISTTQIDLTWTDDDTTQTGYTIELSTDEGVTWGPEATITNPATKSYSDTGLTEGVLYYYRVKATNSVDASDYATTAAAPYLAAPTLLPVSGINGSAVSLQWTDNSANESGYAILQLVDGNWLEIGWTDADATTATIESAFEPGVAYSFQVQAWSDWSNSLPSNTAISEPGAWPAAPPALTAEVISATQVFLSWPASTGASYYKIAQNIEGTDVWALLFGRVDAPQTTYTASGLTAGGTAYSFRVYAVNGSGWSPCAAIYNVATPNNPPITGTPTADADPVTGTSTVLSVTADDDGGEANLTYSWTVLSCPTGGDAWIDKNDTNEAKTTTVTFSKAGDYSFFVIVTDAHGSPVASNTLNVTVNQTLSSIEVTPGDAAMLQGQTRQFIAMGFDQFGDNMTTSPSFTWSKSSGGDSSITSGGLYTAPSTGNEATYTVTAAASGKFGTANVAFAYSLGIENIPGDNNYTSPYLVDLSSYHNITRIEIFNITDPAGLAWDDFSFDTPSGNIVINFDNLADGTIVTNQYQSQGAVFSSDSGCANYVDNYYQNMGNSNPYYIGTGPIGGFDCGRPTYIDFSVPVNNLKFFQLGDNATGTVAQVLILGSSLLELTATDDNNQDNNATAIDSGDRDLYILEDEDGEAKIDLEAAFAGVLGSDVCWMIEGTDLDGDFSDPETATDLPLPITDTAREFIITAWFDAIKNGAVDTSEDTRDIRVHVIPKVISGTIEYAAGRERSPLRYAMLLLSDGQGHDFRTATDGNGNFTFQLEEPPENWAMWSLKAYACTDKVRKVMVINTNGDVYSVDIPLPSLQDGIIDGKITVDATRDHAIEAGTTSIYAESFTGQAFCLFDALITGMLFCDSMPDITTPIVTVEYDSNTTSTITTSSSKYSRITYKANDLPWYTDKLLHEYGHAVATANDFDRSWKFSRAHYEGVNCRSLFWSSTSAKEVGFNEGWADFFSVIAQSKAPVANLTGHNFTYGVNDGKYGQWSVENNSDRLSYGGAGEDEELSVMRMLWDFCDPGNESWDRVEIAVDDLMDTLISHHITTLSSLGYYLTANATRQKIFDYGAILEKENAAPIPLELQDQSGKAKTTWTAADPAPTLIWKIPQGNSSQTGGGTFNPVGDLFNQFWIFIWDANNNLIASFPGSSSSLCFTRLSKHQVAYTIPMDVWLNSIASVPGVKKWSVSGRWDCWADLYRYSSDAHTFTIT